MQKLYKKLLFEVANDKGLLMSLFDVNESETGQTPELLTIRSRDVPDMYFEVTTNPNSSHHFAVKFTSFNPVCFPPRTSAQGTNLQKVRTIFGSWLEQVKLAMAEAEAPDQWKDIVLVSTQSNAEFTSDDKERLRVSLTKFKVLLIREFNPTEDQLREISAKLNHLTEAMDHMNQFDWGGVAINSLIAISIALSQDTAQGHALFNLFKQAVSGVIYPLK
jgi:hypothetical protein